MRIQTKPTQVPQRTEAHVPDPEVTEPRPGRNRLLLLIPEGSLSFRLCSFPDIAAAQNYVQDAGVLMQRGNWGAFWTHDSKPADSDGTPIQAEATVILRDTVRPDVVQLYSFVDMPAALKYLGTSVAQDLDLRSALLYWVTPVSLNVSASTASEMTVNSQGPAAATPAGSAHPIHSSGEGAADKKRPADGRGSEGKLDQVGTEKKGEPSLLSRISRQARAWPGWDGLAPRIAEAALLKRETYQSISRDPQATGRAALIVGAGAVSAGIGALGGGIGPGFGHVIAALAGWTVCVATVQIVGTRVFGGRIVSLGVVPQAVGLASVPALLLVLGAVPVYGPLFVLGIFVWLLVAMTVAVEPALELDRESAIMTAAVAWLLFFAIAVVAPTILF
ncbi:MAG TPA: YIP1 family protein [Dehalococcoidia bacterium]|jgi:uncharacterized low-complexity protein